MAKKGVGIDCLHFVREVMVSAGVTETFDFPYYSPRWGIGRGNNVLERLFMRCYDAKFVGFDEPLQDGDVLIFAVGRQSNHCGIVLDGQCWHSQAARVVYPIQITADIMDSLQSIVRLKAPGLRFRPEELTREDFQQ